jgi:F-type H+-transporting ATPase subunit a
MVIQNIDLKQGKQYFPFILTLFVFLAILNIVGIIPYTFSPTAHIAITFGLSCSIYLGVLFISLKKFGTGFFSMFFPADLALGAAPFLVVIELLSHISRAVSLGVRLFANITAGHLLFAILSGFTFQMLVSGDFLIMFAGLFPFGIVVFITCLEMAVSLIQAYIFALLTCIYLSETIHLH